MKSFCFEPQNYKGVHQNRGVYKAVTADIKNIITRRSSVVGSRCRGENARGIWENDAADRRGNAGYCDRDNYHHTVEVHKEPVCYKVVPDAHGQNKQQHLVARKQHVFAVGGNHGDRFKRRKRKQQNNVLPDVVDTAGDDCKNRSGNNNQHIKICGQKAARYSRNKRSYHHKQNIGERKAFRIQFFEKISDFLCIHYCFSFQKLQVKHKIHYLFCLNNIGFFFQYKFARCFCFSFPHFIRL